MTACGKHSVGIKEALMQCPMCRKLKHSGPCDPVYLDDEPATDLEMLEMEFERAKDRLEEYRRKHPEEKVPC